ncbi:MAG: YqgE/AlgH family protein [Methylococcales bacterium]|jgi:putative transcriptional regulator|nr:YqgE/AlgH family protein [Methylococcales bacterium]MBT3699727.1 YqgE/AlgH family protein [Methylococcales bacterium]MBT3815990.1 YqgE/AlgH family protein [Methylococcales bacterium]MBT4031859.1 YqgE/AlgH family protein [Methylococcales bacterium]MBT4348195.1 YqgE/AlgH family protein [Methylococcales bacterium]
MKQPQSFTNQLLVAMPHMVDPNFHQTVTLLCQHDQKGALGIIINRPANIKAQDIFQQMDITLTQDFSNNIPVYAGGPVQPDRGFVLHTPSADWDSSLIISDYVALTTSRDILEAIALNEGPKKALIALGYSGWGENQLEQEMIANTWLNTPSNQALLFDTPINQRWQKAAEQIGVDISLLTSTAGHG